MNGVILRNIADEDIPLFKQWLNLPHVAAWYHNPSEWITEVENRNGEYSFIQHFIVVTYKRSIGFCQFYKYLNSGEDWHGNTDISAAYSIDYFIADTEYLGKGYGTAIIKALIKKIEKQKNAKRIIVQPEPENKASCGTLLSCGFNLDAVNKIYILDL